MGTNARKIIGLFLLPFCAQVLVAIGLGGVFGTAHDLMGFMPLFALESEPEKTTKPAVLVSYRCHTGVIQK